MQLTLPNGTIITSGGDATTSQTTQSSTSSPASPSSSSPTPTTITQSKTSSSTSPPPSPPSSLPPVGSSPPSVGSGAPSVGSAPPPPPPPHHGTRFLQVSEWSLFRLIYPKNPKIIFPSTIRLYYRFKRKSIIFFYSKTAWHKHKTKPENAGNPENYNH